MFITLNKMNEEEISFIASMVSETKSHENFYRKKRRIHENDFFALIVYLKKLSIKRNKLAKFIADKWLLWRCVDSNLVVLRFLLQ